MAQRRRAGRKGGGSRGIALAVGYVTWFSFPSPFPFSGVVFLGGREMCFGGGGGAREKDVGNWANRIPLAGWGGVYQVLYFKKRRVMEVHKKNTLEKLLKEGVEPLPESQAQVGMQGKPPTA